MSGKSRMHWLLGAGLAVIVLVAAGLVAFRLAVSGLQQKVAAALGPKIEMASLQVGWSGVVIEGLRMPGPKSWPTGDALRAERVVIVPTLQSLVSGDVVEIRSITVTRPYLSALRKRDGKLSALPGRGGDGDATARAAIQVSIGEIIFEDGVIEVFDATLAKQPLRIRIEQIAASFDDVTVPGLLGRSQFELDGVVKSVPPDGTLRIAGWIELGTRESSTHTTMRSIDLAPLSPYLIEPGEAGIRAGRFDLDLESEVHDRRLHAPGKLTLTGLELEPATGVLSTFMGLSRSAMLASLQEKGNRITVDFTLEGDVANPEFSINAALSRQFAFSMAKTLGLSLGGLVEGVGTIGLKGGESVGEAASGVGGALLDLIGGKPEK